MRKMLKDLSAEDQDRVLRAVRAVEDKGGILSENGRVQNYGHGVGYGKPLEPEPDGTKLVFTWGKLFFYGSAFHKVDPYDPKWAFIVDLSNKGWPAGSTSEVVQTIAVGGHKVEEKTLAALKEFLTFKYTKVVKDPQPHIKIDWPDYKALGANTDFWEYLAQMLPEGNILINCQGGKGRTGTALTALFMAANRLAEKYVSAGEAVALVRKNHHPGAVESAEQANYLHALAKEWARELGVVEEEKKK
jgi:hypothetical protein